MPITPFPTLFTAPGYRPANNTLELTVSNFFYEHPKTRVQTPLDVYLGSLGPLRSRFYQATHPGPLTAISAFDPSLGPPSIGNAGPSVEPQVPNGAQPTMPVPSAPARFVATGPLHTIVVVEMPPLGDIIKALGEDLMPPGGEEDGAPGSGSGQEEQQGERESGIGATVAPPQIAGRSLPLLFIRSVDGVGYHSGRTIACENVFSNMDLSGMGGNPSNGSPGSIDTGWLAAAQAAAAAEGGLHGWTLRVM